MAVNLLGSGNARVDWGDVAALSGMTSLTVAVTVKTANPLAGSRLFQQWGNLETEQSFILQPSGDELLFGVHKTGGGYRIRTSNNANMVADTLYRIVARWRASDQAMAIFLNGVSLTLDATSSSSPVSLENATSVLSLGHDPDEAGSDGLDGDYSEVAFWNQYAPDWFCEGYGKGLSPFFYKPQGGIFFYAPLFSISDVRSVFGAVTPGTNTAGTTAPHPHVFYQASPMAVGPPGSPPEPPTGGDVREPPIMVGGMGPVLTGGMA